MKTIPALVPADEGVKVDCIVILCPGLKVIGNVGPLTENPLPVDWKAEIFTFQERRLVSTTGRVELVPTATCPKERLEGLIPIPSLVTPVPRTAKRSVGFEASLVNVTVPGVHPVVVGEKITFSETLCPAGTINGNAAGAANCAKLAFIAETVTLVWPPLVKTTTAVSLWPITTLPRCRADGAHVSCCVAARTHRGSIVTKIMTVKMEETRVDRG
jgi:hypothetical protein